MMKPLSVMRQSFDICRAHFRELMLTLLVELALRGIALAPLLFLVLPQTAPLALLCVPLYLFIVLPARQNVALALQDMLDGGSPFTLQLISAQDYGRKLLLSLIATHRMFLWCLPLIAAIATVLWAKGISIVTVYQSIMAMGGGNSMRGAIIIAVIFVLTLIPPVVGCAFHCGKRHAAALGQPGLIRGRRSALMRLWFTGLLTLVPFLVAAAIASAGYVGALIAAVNEFFMTFEFTLPDPTGTLVALAVVTAVLLLPAVPLRTLLPAVYLRSAQAGDVAATHHDAA